MKVTTQLKKSSIAGYTMQEMGRIGRLSLDLNEEWICVEINAMNYPVITFTMSDGTNEIVSTLVSQLT